MKMALLEEIRFVLHYKSDVIKSILSVTTVGRLFYKTHF